MLENYDMSFKWLGNEYSEYEVSLLNYITGVVTKGYTTDVSYDGLIDHMIELENEAS